MPEQKYKKKRARSRERRRLAAAWRRTYRSLPIIIIVPGLLIYLAATAPKVGSPKDMVRAQLSRTHLAKLKEHQPSASTRGGAATASNLGAGSTATNPRTPAPLVNRDFEEIGFDRLGGFPINVTQLTYSSQNSREQPSEVDQQIPESIRKCDGRRVAVRGFMLPLKFDKGVVTEFLLLKSQALCCYGAIPRINEWIVVDSKGTRAIMDRPLVIRGRLHVGETREDGLLTGIYRMDAE